MPLICPECSSASFNVVFSREIGAGEKWDEVSVQILVCAGCGFEGAGLYEESRRGAEDVVCHRVFFIPREIYVRIKSVIIKQCDTDADSLFKDSGGNYFPSREIEFRL